MLHVARWVEWLQLTIKLQLPFRTAYYSSRATPRRTSRRVGILNIQLNLEHTIAPSICEKNLFRYQTQYCFVMKEYYVKKSEVQ